MKHDKQVSVSIFCDHFLSLCCVIDSETMIMGSDSKIGSNFQKVSSRPCSESDFSIVVRAWSLMPESELFQGSCTQSYTHHTLQSGVVTSTYTQSKLQIS